MIKIKKEILKNIPYSEKEVCGFFLGNNDEYDKMEIIKNVSRIDSKYRMSRLALIIFSIKMLFQERRQFIMFHTHKKNEGLSLEDIDSMVFGFTYGIIFNRTLRLYKRKMFWLSEIVSYELI